MNEQEIRDLLARLDERTANIWRMVEEQELHLRQINGSLREQAIQSEVNKVALFGRNGDRGLIDKTECLERNFHKLCIFLAGVLGTGAIGGGIYKLIEVIGR